jgi:hypothetical protein
VFRELAPEKPITPSLLGPILFKATHPPSDLLPPSVPLPSTFSHHQSCPSSLTFVPSHSTLLHYLCSILLLRVVLIMVQPSHGSSSSLAPTVSSSQSPSSITADDRAVKGLRYRREEIVDGNCVHISETVPRRRRHEISSRLKSDQDTPLPPYRSSTIEISENRPSAARQSIIIHQSKSSPGKELSSRARNDSFVDIPSAVNEYWDLPSREPSEVINEYGELSPPPTPRFQRLPTPDLEPLLKVGSFCDCWGCYRESLYPNEYQGSASKRCCSSL